MLDLFGLFRIMFEYNKQGLARLDCYLKMQKEILRYILSAAHLLKVRDSIVLFVVMANNNCHFQKKFRKNIERNFACRILSFVCSLTSPCVFSSEFFLMTKTVNNSRVACSPIFFILWLPCACASRRHHMERTLLSVLSLISVTFSFVYVT